MKNKYIIQGDTVKILIVNKKGEIFESLIDLEDFEKVNSYTGSFCATWAENTNGFYAIMTIYYGKINGKYKNNTIRLHRIVMNCTDSKSFIDHINHNTLDNRKANLRLTSNNKNSKNRKGKNTNNKSGYRNVTWLKNENKWMVQLQINGKNTRLATFDDVDEAGKFAEDARKKYYGEFAGLN